ncbi:MAG TPA: PAS domain-containing sensor histidine kinase [Kofleriaceae bacterium]|jgi:PAS domain S-box-containing protein
MNTGAGGLPEAVRAQLHLLAQMREANEKLLLATLRAEELADRATEARIEIAQNEERFRSLVGTSAAVVWYANADGFIHVDPESWLHFTGLDVDTQEEEPGWLHAVHPEDRAQVLESWAAAVAGRAEYVHQHRLRRPDGSYARVVSRAVPIPRTGTVREWIGMMTDVTDRMLVEEARERFIAILGHDLRTPLAAIASGAELLQHAALPAPLARAVERIGRSANRMDAMIQDVLDFARGRFGNGIPVRRVPCDLERIATEEVEEMRQAYPGRDIRIEASGDLAGICDASRMEQLLSNLIGNALQHGADPVVVGARSEGDEIVLAVHNQGPPIPDGLQALLFEPFVEGTASASGGLGLGLYIASEIVRAHGGSIAVSSSEGLGTRFEIRLPRHS